MAETPRALYAEAVSRLALLALLLCAAPAYAQVDDAAAAHPQASVSLDPAVLRRARALLAQIEAGPDPAPWRALGDAGEAALIAIAADTPEHAPLYRRALRRLGHFDSTAGAQVLQRALQSAEGLVARAAYLALAERQTRAGSLREFALSQLDHPRWEVRRAAVAECGEHVRAGDARARAALEQRRLREGRPAVLRALQRALTR